MIAQKPNPDDTRFGIPRSLICPWHGRVLMAFYLFCLVWGCGGDVEYVGAGEDGWEPDLKEIALEFAADAKEFDLPLGKLGRIHVLKRNNAKVDEQATPEEPLAGVCKIWSGRHGRQFRGEIYIKDDIEGDLLRRLVYHELTHCVYEQDHFGEDGDIMFPRLNGKLLTWEEARERHFTMLKERLGSAALVSGLEPIDVRRLE